MERTGWRSVIEYRFIDWIHRVGTYSQVRTASGQHDFVGFEVPSLGGQRTIDQRAALQEAVEHGDQGPLMVVPSQAKLLAYGHDDEDDNGGGGLGDALMAFGFSRYLARAPSEKRDRTTDTRHPQMPNIPPEYQSPATAVTAAVRTPHSCGVLLVGRSTAHRARRSGMFAIVVSNAHAERFIRRWA